MRHSTKKILWVVLPMAVFLITSHVLAQEQSEGDQTSETKQDVSEPAPGLADIIPKATKLSAGLATLKNSVTGVLDTSEFEEKYTRIEENLKDPAAQLQQIKDSKDVRINKLVEIKKVIERENELLEEIGRPLGETIRQFGAWRNDWQAEKKQWNQWQSILLQDGDLDQLKSIFAKAQDTIDKALEIVNSQLDSMLTVQERAGNIQAKIVAISVELDALILAARAGVRVNVSPPMFSSRYFSQYSSELWYALQKGLAEILWPDRRFFDRNGLILFLQFFYLSL